MTNIKIQKIKNGLFTNPDLKPTEEYFVMVCSQNPRTGELICLPALNEKRTKIIADSLQCNYILEYTSHNTKRSTSILILQKSENEIQYQEFADFSEALKEQTAILRAEYRTEIKEQFSELSPSSDIINILKVSNLARAMGV